MGRRGSSVLEDFLDIATKLPWWLSVVLAIVLYFFLHSIAITETPTVTGTHNVGNAVTGQIFKTFAGIFQYVLPGILLIGAGASFFRSRKRSALFAHVADETEVGTLNNMSWREFEGLVGEAFRQRGYQVEETGGQGADGGIDLVLRKGSERFLVQCKQWRAYKVGVNVVRELYGVMAAAGAVGGFVVTSGKFTQEAEEFAHGRNIELIDGVGLMALIHEAQAARPTGQVRSEPTFTASSAGVNTGATPACPRCGSLMVKRVAKQGSMTGSQFWGCSKFPACRGTQQISGSDQSFR